MIQDKIYKYSNDTIYLDKCSRTNSGDPGQTAHRSSLIRISIVCHLHCLPCGRQAF